MIRSGDRMSSESGLPVPGAFPEPYSPVSTTNHQSLTHAVHARRSEFTRPKKIRIKVGTWNVAALKGTEKDIGSWFIGGKGIEERLAGLGVDKAATANRTAAKETVEVQEARANNKQSTIPKGDQAVQPHDDEVGLYVLGLQEIVDVGSATEAFRPYSDPSAANRYKTALEYQLPSGYVLVAERQLIGLLLLIYASPSVAADIKFVSTTSVGTGLMGYMGNKGAVTTRLVLGETTRLAFINSHLGAGSDKTALERRNWDYGQIVNRTRFDPIEDAWGLTNNSGEQLGEEDFAFWFGDLNYRIDAPGDDVRRLLMLHTRNAFDDQQKLVKGEIHKLEELCDDTSNASEHDLTQMIKKRDEPEEQDELPPEEDPASLDTTLLSLLKHDELHAQMAARKAFHDGWQEGPIRFLPTYKYDVGSMGVFDSSDKRRGPSWCDRILYRTRTNLQDFRTKMEEEAKARKRDEEMKAKGIEDAASEDDVLFDYDPEDDIDEAYDETAEPQPVDVVTKSGEQSQILQEYYNAHQRVLSSDHKPLDAIFTLTYDAIDPEEKARIQAEVAKDLDRAENEGRPTVTVIADKVPFEEDTDTDTRQNITKREGIDFGHVRLGQHKHRNVTIANTGQVSATMCFVNRPTAGEEIEGPIPPWMAIEWDREPDHSAMKSPKAKKGKPEPPSVPCYTLDPGDACNVSLEARVEDMELVDRLNDGAASLDDVLILRVQDGRDHFLPVTAEWEVSALEKAMGKLAGVKESVIRKMQQQKPDASGGT